MWVVRVGGDDGELRLWHDICEGRRGRREVPNTCKVIPSWLSCPILAELSPLRWAAAGAEPHLVFEEPEGVEREEFEALGEDELAGRGVGRAELAVHVQDLPSGQPELQGYLARKKHPLPEDHHRSPGIGLLNLRYTYRICSAESRG